ncbi:MAG: hypothetical protein ACHQXA_06205 [Gemmatimonadales bacterium]
MTDDSPHNVAGEPLPPGVDLLGLGLRALGFAVSVGAAAITGVIWGVQSLHPAGSTSGPESAGPAFYLLIFGTVGAMALAGLTAWFVLRPVDSWFRRGGLSIVCAFLSFVISLATLPANAIFGRTGLLAMTALYIAGATLFGRSLRRWSRSA